MRVPQNSPDPRVITPDTPNVTPRRYCRDGGGIRAWPRVRTTATRRTTGESPPASAHWSITPWARPGRLPRGRGFVPDDAPRTTRTAPDSADALHAHAAAKVWRATMARRIASEVIADLPESKRDTLGIMLVEDRLRGMRQAFKDAGTRRPRPVSAR